MSKVHYYKVLSYSGGELLSTNAPLNYMIEYKPGVWTKPIDNTGGIFVFKELDDAINFSTSASQIWMCEVKNPRKLLVRSFVDPNDIKFFWEEYFALRKQHKSVKKIKWNSNTPKGTYLASEIMLVKQCQ